MCIIMRKSLVTYSYTVHPQLLEGIAQFVQRTAETFCLRLGQLPGYC